ncbi:formyltransferase family protein [Methylosinus sp. RM1]|uniref:formyltransferase family protein n=1 Tax=Methylosinus sp. RM1 TaxID=2583817 RepID=UPI00140A83B1|nr:formyltransferase family protein [Methylosinus sp. RM1]
MLRLGFLASNNGTAMRAVIQDITLGRLDAQAVLVVSNKDSAQAISFAREAGVPTCVIPTVRDPAGADLLLCEALLASGTNLVILSGYLRKLGPMTLRAFENRILNTHPALLPAFGGSGMYGRKVHEAVLTSGAQETGATIHLVDGDYDHGSIIAQERFPIPAGIEARGLESLVMEVECSLMLSTLGRIASGAIPL